MSEDAMSNPNRETQWEEIYIKAPQLSKLSALNVLWGYLEAAEKRKCQLAPTELLDLIVKRLQSGRGRDE